MFFIVIAVRPIFCDLVFAFKVLFFLSGNIGAFGRRHCNWRWRIRVSVGEKRLCAGWTVDARGQRGISRSRLVLLFNKELYVNLA